MQDVVDMYVQLRDSAHNRAEEIARLYGINTHEEPAECFNMSFNDITLTLELLSYYNDLWGRLEGTSCDSVEEARVENAQRVILIQKKCFIGVMSALEFTAKKFVIAHPNLLTPFNGRIYLSGIMSKSRDANIIDDASLVLWQGAIRLRNSLVHNNGISEETATYTYPDIELRVTEEQMTRANLRLFGHLTEWILAHYELWLRNANNQINQGLR